MTMTDEDVLRRARENSQLARIRALELEVDALRAQLEGDLPRATAWLQSKVWRQRVALTALNHRVVAQRFYLRLCTELGRLPTREEYHAAKADAERWELAALEAEEPLR